MLTKPFSPERLFHIRRLRKARRLFRQAPLFAFMLMQREYSNYTYIDFMDDLRLRSKKKKRYSKSPLVRYGRYGRMEKMLIKYRETKEVNLALLVLKLRKHMTRPYRVLVRTKEVDLEYTLSPFIPIEAIEQLVGALNKCRTEKEADEMVQLCREAHRVG